MKEGSRLPCFLSDFTECIYYDWLKEPWLTSLDVHTQMKWAMQSSSFFRSTLSVAWVWPRIQIQSKHPNPLPGDKPKRVSLAYNLHINPSYIGWSGKNFLWLISMNLNITIQNQQENNFRNRSYCHAMGCVEGNLERSYSPAPLPWAGIHRSKWFFLNRS